MNFEKEIEKIIEQYIKNGDKDFIIYPYGTFGRMVKQILNNQYGISEKFVVDNKYSEYNASIRPVNDIPKLSRCGYKWLVAVENYDVRQEIIKLVEPYVSDGDIVDIFSKVYDEPVRVFDDSFVFLSKMADSTVPLPCREFVNLIDGLKRQNKKLCVAEVGVGYGATAVEVCSLLGERDEYLCFDFQESIDGLVSDLKNLKNVSCKLRGIGNSRKTLDSYCWGLSNLVYEMRDNGQDGMLDAVYLDGSHAFAIDGLACVLLKELCKVGGYIVFDDMEWSWEHYADVADKLFTEEQKKECQVNRVVNMFMLNDKHFKRVMLNDNFRPAREIFMRIA